MHAVKAVRLTLAVIALYICWVVFFAPIVAFIMLGAYEFFQNWWGSLVGGLPIAAILLWGLAEAIGRRFKRPGLGQTRPR